MLDSNGNPIYSVSEDKKIVDWRMGNLAELGFAHSDCSAIGLRRDIDLEKVRKMVAAGATHTQVRRIVL